MQLIGSSRRTDQPNLRETWPQWLAAGLFASTFLRFKTVLRNEFNQDSRSDSDRKPMNKRAI
ncbi:hypothetical protein SynBIOSE41_01301 [Synechococcus sp. BIOS-E4-1]|nr:hypothetical protein SynBIOSE41_01301 [Synechococcus sp. BIOS-E4-1]